MPSQFDRPIGAAKVCAAFAAGRDDRAIGAVLPGISGGVLSVVFGIYEPIMAFLSNPREALSQYGRRTFASGALGGSGRIFALLRVPNRIFPDTL